MNTLYSILLTCIFAGCGYTKLANSSSDGIPLYPIDLQIVYSSSGVTLNSVESSLSNRSHSIRCILSHSELSKVYSALKDIDVDSLQMDISSTMSKNESDRSFWFRYGSLVRQLSWSSYIVHTNTKFVQVEHLESVLDDVLFNNSLYRELPPPDPIPM